MTFLTVRDLSMHWQCPIKSITILVNQCFCGEEEERTKLLLNGLILTETIFPSVGMYAGRLDKRNFVCSVLKFVSSLAFCSTRGGLCLRL